MSEPQAPELQRPLDARALERVLARLNRSAEAPWLHGEVARRMAERLSVIRERPRVVLDWWARLGGGREALAAAYPQARVVAVETRLPERKPPGGVRNWTPLRWLSAAPQIVLQDAVEPGSAQLVWANMMLHGVMQPQAMMVHWHRALAVDGFLMFSTLGPGTLQSLRGLYGERGWPSPHAPFVDMHDLGDMLVHAGFADPVMDQETLTLTWTTAGALLAELRTLGGNVALSRCAAVRTPRWRKQLEDLLEQRLRRSDGRLALEFEVVYGHAFRPAPRPRLSGQTAVPLDDMRSMVRAGRRKP